MPIRAYEGHILGDVQGFDEERCSIPRDQPLLSSVGICKEIYLITVGLTEANVATVLAGWLSK